MADDFTMRILCSNESCKHNADTGYYSLCKHPDFQDLVYCGITRMYKETCNAAEPRNRSNQTSSD